MGRVFGKGNDDKLQQCMINKYSFQMSGKLRLYVFISPGDDPFELI